MINVIQAPRASTPYPWAKFAQWAAAQGFSPEEIQTIVENGVEPEMVLVECTVDPSVVYPGLPSLERIPFEDGAEPHASTNEIR